MKKNIGKIAVVVAIGYLLVRISGLNLAVIGQSLGLRKPITVSRGVKSVYSQRESIKMEVKNENGSKLETKLIDANNSEIPVEIIENDEDGISKIKVNPPPRFKSGRYKLVVKDASGNIVEQDFLWGVLAINPNKSVYFPGETADLAMAVLDESGKMVCTAKLTLKVTNSEGNLIEELSTENGRIKVNPECQLHDFTIKPDYETQLKLEKIGNYNLELKAETSNGSYTINDGIEVAEAIKFEVERSSATRIYPVNAYPMEIKIKAAEDFDGSVYENVPAIFEISQSKEMNIEKYKVVDTYDETKKIKWEVKLKAGEEKTLAYVYKAPEISPQFYLTGPLSMATLTDLVYTENRQWQIAADEISPAVIRQEINIIDSPVTVGGTDTAIINLDTTKYNGASYYFEVVAKVASGTLTVNLSTGNTNTVGIGITNSGFVRVRQSFTPETGSFDYRLNLVNGTTPVVQAARIIILQSASYITDTETQVEIGNNEIGLTMTPSTVYSAPVFQAVGTSAAGTGTSLAISWPTHQPGDVALLFIETVGGTTPGLILPRGFQQVTNSPQSVGTTTTGTTLAVYWARATSFGMGSPVVAPSRDHTFAVMVTYRGCINTGNPWDVTAGSVKGTASTRTTFDSVTTTVTNTLLVLAAARQNDLAAAAWSAEVNPNLTNITERHDYGTASGNGGGILVADGLLAAAGVGGTSSATVTSTINAEMTIALKGQPDPVAEALNSPKYWTYNSSLWSPTPTFYAETTWRKNDTILGVPQYVSKGAFTSGTGSLTVGVPTGYQDGDVFVMMVESANETITVMDSGWTEVDNSPQYTGTAAAAGGVRLAVFYKIVSGTQVGVGVSDSGNHTTAIIANFRGVDLTNPITVSAGSTDASATTSMSWPSVDTTVDNQLVLLAAGLDNDANSTNNMTTAMTNSNLTNLYEVHDQTVTSGVGGGLGIAIGVKGSAGTVGNTTTTGSASTTHAYLTLALRGLPDATSRMDIKLQEDNGSFGSWSDVANIATDSTVSNVVSRSRTTFTPNNGHHYRLVRSLVNNSFGSTFDIYNAKIIIDQTGATGITKLEAQYLLLNTKSTTIGSTLSYPTLWDSTEWVRTTNVYKHAADSLGIGTSAQLVDINDSNNLLPGSKVMGAGQTISGTISMPTTGHNIDTWLLGSGEVDASRILVAVTINMPPAEYYQASYRWSDDSEGETHTTSWLAVENADVTEVVKNSNIRLRFSVNNIGDVGAVAYRLQIAPLGAATGCTDVVSGNFIDIPTTFGVGTSLGIMTTSPNFADQATTTRQLTISATTFVSGRMVEYSSNQTNSISLAQNEYTEMEYVFQLTSSTANNTSYCLRTSNAGTALQNYTRVAMVTTGASNISGNSFQRKTFFDNQNSAYWRSSFQGGGIKFEYSADGNSWNTSTGLSYSTDDFSVWYAAIGDTEFVYVAVNNDYDIKIRQGVLTNNSVTWDADVATIFDGTGTNDRYAYPYITVDNPISGSPHLWVTARYYNGSNYMVKARDTISTADTDPSTWTYNTDVQLSTDQASSNVYANIVPLPSGDMYTVFTSGTTIEGIKWDDAGSAWRFSSNWYNSNWLYRVKLTIDASKVTADQTDFPVYVNLADLTANFHSHVYQTDARDIRVTKSDGVTELPREVVSYNSTTDSGELYFKYSGTLSGTNNTDIYIYYGNSGASDYATNATYGAQNVWDSSYAGVWHFKEGSGASVSDSKNGHTATLQKTINWTTSGAIGNAYNFDGNGDGAIITDHNDFDLATFSLEAWAQPNLPTVWAPLLYKGDISSALFQFGTGATNSSLALDFGGSGGWHTLDVTGQVTNSQMNFYAATMDNATDDQIVYKNGVSVGSNLNQTGVPTDYAINGNVGIGILGSNEQPYFHGIIDEVRISNIARSSSWLLAEYNNISASSTFYADYAEETPVGGGGVIATGTGNFNDNISVVSDSSGNINLLFIEDSSTDQVSYMKLSVGSTNWSPAVLVSGAADNNDAYVSLSMDTTSNYLYAFWIDVSSNDIYYSFCDVASGCDTAAEWLAESGQETLWQSTGTNTNLTTNYATAGKIFGEWSDNSTLGWDDLVSALPSGPSINQLLRHGMWFLNGVRQKFTF